MRRAAAAADALSRATWLWRAVGKGNPQAPVELARMYEEGSGVTRNCDQAQLLLRAAAARGNQQAKLSLRDMRIRGGCSPH
jgi:TPR repeat protein